MKKLYILAMCMVLQASSVYSKQTNTIATIKKFLSTKQGKIVTGAVIATTLGMAYYVWTKTGVRNLGSTLESDDMEAMNQARARIAPVVKTKEELLSEELTASLTNYIKSRNTLRDDWKVIVKVTNGSMGVHFYGNVAAYGHNLEEFKKRQYGHYIAEWIDAHKRSDIKTGQFRFVDRDSKREVFGFTLRCVGSAYEEPQRALYKEKEPVIQSEAVWQPSLFTIEPGKRHCEVLFNDIPGKRNLRICFFDIGDKIVTLDKFKKEYMEPIKNYVQSDYRWATRGYKGTVTLEYYQANIWERYEKANTTNPLYKEDLEV